MNLRLLVAAVAVLAAGPAHAAIVTYSVTAGDTLAGSQSFYQSSTQTIDIVNGISDVIGTPQFGGITITATFNRDTTNPAIGTYRNGFVATAGGSSGTPFVAAATASVGITGSPSDFAQVVEGRSGQTMRLSTVEDRGDPAGQFSLDNFDRVETILETWGNGATKRMMIQDVSVSVHAYDATDFRPIDGFDWPQTLPLTSAFGDAYLSVITLLAYVEYDDQGNFLRQVATNSNWGASLTAMSFSTNAVPEPGMLALFGLGALGLAARRRRAA